MDLKIKKMLAETARGRGQITVMTGAGISAESGIPTFRGPEGYWTVGSKAHHPQEMATNRMFTKYPEEVWKWYLLRMDTCRRACPNAGHLALVEMEQCFVDRFTLITQNVDNLHLDAGNSENNTYQIHGNIFKMRCARACMPDIIPAPTDLSDRDKARALSGSEKVALRCPNCGGWARPHVLWFDETYNEQWFRFESALHAAMQTDLLIIVGTSGATNLPNQVARVVKLRGGVIVDVNVERNLFSELAVSDGSGYFMQGESGTILPEMVDYMISAAR